MNPIDKTTIRIPRICCAAGCKKVALYAWRLSDFWLSSCEDHQGGQFSINKPLLALEGKQGE